MSGPIRDAGDEGAPPDLGSFPTEQTAEMREDDAQWRAVGPTEGAPSRTPEKDPDEWTTGDEPMTGPQASYLRTLCQEAGEPFEETLTKAEASKRIEELQARTGRGRGDAGGQQNARA